MPVSQDGARAVHQALAAAGVGIVATVPDTWIAPIAHLAEADPAMQLVAVAREEEAVAVAAGAHVAGARAAVLVQNHGLLAAINPVVSLAFLYKIPLLLLVSHRGDLGEADPWQSQGGLYTEAVLGALRIPVQRLDDADSAGRRIADAQTLAAASLHPVAVLLTRRLLWKD